MTITAPSRPSAAAAPPSRRRPFRAVPQWWRASTRDALVLSLVLVTGLWAVPHGVVDLLGASPRR